MKKFQNTKHNKNKKGFKFDQSVQPLLDQSSDDRQIILTKKKRKKKNSPSYIELSSLSNQNQYLSDIDYNEKEINVGRDKHEYQFLNRSISFDNKNNEKFISRQQVVLLPLFAKLNDMLIYFTKDLLSDNTEGSVNNVVTKDENAAIKTWLGKIRDADNAGSDTGKIKEAVALWTYKARLLIGAIELLGLLLASSLGVPWVFVGLFIVIALYTSINSFLNIAALNKEKEKNDANKKENKTATHICIIILEALIMGLIISAAIIALLERFELIALSANIPIIFCVASILMLINGIITFIREDTKIKNQAAELTWAEDTQNKELYKKIHEIAGCIEKKYATMNSAKVK